MLLVEVVLADVIRAKIPSWTWYLVYFVLTLATGVSSFVFILEHYAFDVNWSHCLPSAFFLLCSACLFVFCILKDRDKPEKVFALIAAPAAVCFALFILPGQVPDEQAHIARVFNFWSSGNYDMYLPAVLNPMGAYPSSYQDLYHALFQAADWNNTVFYERDMSAYLSHLYLFSGLGALVGKVFALNPFICVYFARLANVALFVTVGYLIIKIIPIGKVMMVVYLLNPMCVQQASSCSADAVVNLVCLLFVVYILKLRFGDKLGKKEIVISLLFSALVILSKFAYFPLLFLFMLLVPKIKNKKLRTCIYVSIPLLVLVVALAVIFFYQGDSFKEEFLLARNPSELIKVYVNTFIVCGPNWLVMFAGGILGVMNLDVWPPCFWGYCLLLIFTAFFNIGEKCFFTRTEKAFLLVTVFFAVCLLMLIFRGWSITVDHTYDVILGVQGRYFIPLFILPLLCLFSKRSQLVRRNCLLVYAGLLLLIFFLDATSIVFFYSAGLEALADAGVVAN